MNIMSVLLLLIVIGETISFEEEHLGGQETLETKIQMEPFKPHNDPQVIKQFLKGEYCLYGGSGWWKYEFCYGKKVDRYHEYNGEKTGLISLGQFKEEDHLVWLEQHPTKRPKEANSRKKVSIFYSNGDICDLTGKPRQIEIKLKCKVAESPSAATLYLLEPRTCEYVLGVESPLVCDLLGYADPQTGLFPVGIVDTIGQKDIVHSMWMKIAMGIMTGVFSIVIFFIIRRYMKSKRNERSTRSQQNTLSFNWKETPLPTMESNN